jgi:hypothetical protein
MPRGVYPRKPGLTRNRSARSVEERFWEKVDKEAANDCWEWTGSRSKAGYGTFNLGRRGEGYALAHRFAYESLVGPIPEGLCLDHLCRNEGCVNRFRRVSAIAGTLGAFTDTPHRTARPVAGYAVT